jgi:sn-glycerol 3-phosphate transport system substrate-binding protein
MQFDSTGVVDYLNTPSAWTVDDALKTDHGYDLSQIAASPLKNWNYQGRQLGLPVSASTTVMYYNKTLLDKAGVTTIPTTFAEIIAAAKALPATNADGRKLTALALTPNSPLLSDWIGQMSLPDGGPSYLVNNKNGRAGTATALAADKDGALLDFLQGWKAMYDAGAVLNVSEGLNNLFLTQQTAFLIASTSQLETLVTQAAGRFAVGVAMLPRVSDKSQFGGSVSGSALFMFRTGKAGIPQTAAQTRAAWDFVKYMTSAPIQARFAAATGYMPVNTGAEKESAYTDYIARTPQALVGLKQLSVTSPDLLGLTVGPARDFYYEVMNQISTMLTKNETPAEAEAALVSSLNTMLAEYTQNQS